MKTARTHLRPVASGARRLARHAAVCAWTVLDILVAASNAEAARIVIVSGHQNTYQQASQALQQAAEAAGIECVALELPQGANAATKKELARRLAELNPAAIASAGPSATLLALQALPDVPVVSFMVPNMLDAPFAAPEAPCRTRVSGVAADVSPTDWIAWIRRLCPDCRNLGVLHSDRTRRTAQALREAAQHEGLVITTITADRQRFPDAITALNNEKCDSVLMIPDAKIYNAPNVKRLLLWGIRQKKPVWAFSTSIVKAGALAGQFADSETVARQAAQFVQKVIEGIPPTDLGIQYPRHFGKAVNKRTAQMINVTVNNRLIGAETVCFGEQP